jgi:uncharacterized protein
MDGITVRDNPEQHRFEVLVDGRVGAFAQYRLREGVVVVTHTETDPEFRGRGLASTLAQQTLDQLRERGDRIMPLCPFFAKYLSQHHEYDDLVVEP